MEDENKYYFKSVGDSVIKYQAMLSYLKLQNKDFKPREKITVLEGYHAATIFMNILWERCKGKFSENDWDHLGQFAGNLVGDPGSLGIWRRYYLTTTKKDAIPRDLLYTVDNHFISPAEAFKIMQADCLLHFTTYGFEFHEVIELLDAMLNNHSEHQLEWELWQEAILRAVNGEKMGYG